MTRIVCMVMLALCYTGSAAEEKDLAIPSNKWIKGRRGSSCEDTCAKAHRSCDPEMQSTIDTCELVKAAFKEAGYECKGCHEARSYDGTPFSTGRPIRKSDRDDDCAPISPGTKSSCKRNDVQPLHSPLCACKHIPAPPKVEL